MDTSGPLGSRGAGENPWAWPASGTQRGGLGEGWRPVGERLSDFQGT